jgi:biopolymer transport protein ExbD
LHFLPPHSASNALFAAEQRHFSAHWLHTAGDGTGFCRNCSRHGIGCFSLAALFVQIFQLMRRFSQKNQLVTLNDINITPLLDLAFVLLIIFIITTPLLEQNLKLNLPTGGAENSTVRKDQVRTIEVNRSGGYVVRGRSYSLAELEQLLGAEFRTNPQLALYIRADSKEQWENIFEILQICHKLKISRIDFAARPAPK